MRSRRRSSANTDSYRHRLGNQPEAHCRALLEELEQAIVFEGPETIGMMIAEPVQNSGGSFVPPPGYWAGLRELCDRYGILLCVDEVICAWAGWEHGLEANGWMPGLT